MSDPSETSTSPRDGESPSEALARARDHARNAAAETIAAMRALLDAAALGMSAQPAEHHRMLGALARALDDLAERFSSGNTDVSSLILDALDAEVARWEGRSRDDPESRAVLRAFLGLREILWEFGVRSREPAQTSETNDEREEPRSASTTERKRPRVQRVEVQG